MRRLTRRSPSLIRPVGALGVLVFAALLLVACGGPKNFTNENDRLRREVLSLESRISSLESGNAELRARLAEAERRGEAPMPESVREALPRAGRLELLEPLRDLSVDGRDTGRVRVRVRPIDGRGRFVQVAGSLTVEVIVLPPLLAGANGAARAEADHAPIPMSEDRLFREPPIGIGARRLAHVTLTPAELREAYRAGLSAPSYWVDIPGVFGTPELLVRVRLEDAVTGVTHTAERLWRVPPIEP